MCVIKQFWAINNCFEIFRSWQSFAWKVYTCTYQGLVLSFGRNHPTWLAGKSPNSTKVYNDQSEGFRKWGYPNSWMVYMRNPRQNRWFGNLGYPYFKKPPYTSIYWFITGKITETKPGNRLSLLAPRLPRLADQLRKISEVRCEQVVVEKSSEQSLKGTRSILNG